MTLLEKIRSKILPSNKREFEPKDEKYTYVSDSERIKIENIKAYKVWYRGDANDLLSYYWYNQMIGFNGMPLHNRNNRNLFWALSSEECDIKRVHSGVAKVIANTLSDVVGKPIIKLDVATQNRWEKIEKETDFLNKLTQQGRPLTEVVGYGAWKINFDRNVSKYPTIEFVDGENVEFIYEHGILFGIIFKSYYKDKDGNDFVLLEKRSKDSENSYIDYEFYKLKANGNEIEEATEADKNKFNINTNRIIFKGLNEILAVPSIYFYDNQYTYGVSIYEGKIDLFDFMDEILSQASQTTRVSTPVEYYSRDVLLKGPNGEIGRQKLYNRQFVQKEGIPNGDGTMQNDIVTTQPDLNFEKYAELFDDVLYTALLGIMSPATLGKDLSKRDNAEAQREKEKVTITTRKRIIDSETIMIEKLVRLTLLVDKLMNETDFDEEKYDITVSYNEFGSPSFETKIKYLGYAWNKNQISAERFIDLLWGDRLSEEEKNRELEYLKERKANEEINMETMINVREPEDML